ncbi:MAG TPA: 3-deoxy-7-phosphoheptulonate synthase, partial [Candidatus Paceibacterota bacterium]
VAQYADILQVGSRNMQNFVLLTKLGKIHKPVLLKRGLAATVEEWLQAAEYILLGGNQNVILCERGVRTGVDREARFMLDIGAIAAVKRLTHLPVIADPSHAAGRADLVVPLAVAAIAAGADGLIVEIHPDSENALSDGKQALGLDELAGLTRRAWMVAAVSGRTCLSVSREEVVWRDPRDDWT